MLQSHKKNALITVLDELSDEQIDRVFMFALSMKERKTRVKTVSAGQLAPLRGLVSWGGDAVEDAERIYE